MKIMLDVGHPAHVHLFKHVIRILEKNGHQVFITSRDKEVLVQLLDAYGFEHHIISRQGKGWFGFASELLIRDYNFYKLARAFNPDLLCGVSEVITHAGKLLGKPSIFFTDSEPTRITDFITLPFARVICTPTCFLKDLGRRQVRYNGYHELAYLHPNYFKPDPSVPGELGLRENDRFAILRFVSWDATHDLGQRGLRMVDKVKLVAEMQRYGRVLITSEGSLPEEFEKYRITTTPEKIHHLLYYATMCIGEGATMATEAALLGTPSIYISTLASQLGNFIELEQKYDLIYSFREADEAIQKALELLQQPDLKEKWAEKRERLLADMIDVTQFMVDFIQNYPESFTKYRESQTVAGAGK